MTDAKQIRHYEIINPSDKVLVSCDDDMIAAICVLILGSGKYALRRDDDEEVLPLFLFGGAEEWLKTKEIDLGKFITTNAEAMAVCFESAFYGGMGEMRALDAALASLPPAQMLEARGKYNDSKRSSLNDIGAACVWWAKRCRKRAAEETSNVR